MQQREPAAMWTCKTCGEVLEDQFGSCWRCAGEAYRARFELTEDACPFCGAGNVVQGRLVEHGAGDGPTSYSFQGVDGEKASFAHLDVRSTYHCPACGALLISGVDEVGASA